MDYNAISASFSINGDKVQTINPSPIFSNAASTGKSFYTVNGRFLPNIIIPTESATLLRMVNAGTPRTLELELDSTASKLCTLTLVARDGVFQFTPYPTLTAMVFAPGTREDVVIFW